MGDLLLGELFAGVGGFSLGMERAGYRTAWQVEIDAACQGVLARHWPRADRYGDICAVSGADLAPVDVISFGSPCQDLSVAGKRAGLAGARSGLFHEAIRIIKEMRDATARAFPESQYGRTWQAPSQATAATTSGRPSTPWQTQGRWSSSGPCWTRAGSECPSDGAECLSSLSSILQPPQDVPTRYYLSARAAAGILRRATRRGKTLPAPLAEALAAVAGPATPTG